MRPRRAREAAGPPQVCCVCHRVGSLLMQCDLQRRYDLARFASCAPVFRRCDEVPGRGSAARGPASAGDGCRGRDGCRIRRAVLHEAPHPLARERLLVRAPAPTARAIALPIGRRRPGCRATRSSTSRRTGRPSRGSRRSSTSVTGTSANCGTRYRRKTGFAHRARRRRSAPLRRARCRCPARRRPRPARGTAPGSSRSPASAACTDCRIRTVPVSGSTATRTACTLNDERPLVAVLAAGRRRCPPRVRCARRGGRDELGERDEATARLHAAGREAHGIRPGDPARRSRACAPRAAGTRRAAPCRPPVIPAEAKAPVSWRTRSVSAARSTIRSRRRLEHGRRDLAVHGASCRCRTRPCPTASAIRAVGAERRRRVRDDGRRGPSSAMHRRAPCPRRRASRRAPRRRCRAAARPARGRGTGRGRSCPTPGLLVLVVHGEERVALPHGVEAAQVERVDAEPLGEHVHRRLDAEDHLAEPVAAERAGRHVVRVDDLGVDALDRAAVDVDRLGAAVEHHADARGCRRRRCRSARRAFIAVSTPSAVAPSVTPTRASDAAPTCAGTRRCA